MSMKSDFENKAKRPIVERIQMTEPRAPNPNPLMENAAKVQEVTGEPAARVTRPVFAAGEATPVADAARGLKAKLGGAYQGAKNVVGGGLRMAGNAAGVGAGGVAAYQGARDGDTLKTTAGLGLAGTSAAGLLAPVSATAAGIAALPATAVIGAGSAGYLAGDMTNEALQKNRGLSNRIGGAINRGVNALTFGQFGVDGDAADARMAAADKNAGSPIARAGAPVAAAAVDPVAAERQRQAAALQTAARMQDVRLQQQGSPGLPSIPGQPIDARGLPGGSYEAAKTNQVIGQFNGRDITKAEAEARGSRLSSVGNREGGGMMANLSKPEILDFGGGQGGGGGIASRAAAINKQFDDMAAELRAQSGGRAPGTLSNRLLRLQEARAQALGQDAGQGVDARGQDIGARVAGQKDSTDRRGQDLDFEAKQQEIAGAAANNKARIIADMQANGIKRADETFKRFSDQATSLFTKAGEDGKPVADPAMSAQFLAELQQNAPEVFAMDPIKAGPLLLEAKQRFIQNQEDNAANGTTNSTWGGAGSVVENPTVGDAVSSSAVDLTDVGMDAIEGLPLVKDRRMYIDSEGRRRVVTGDEDVDYRRRNQIRQAGER